MSGQRAKRTRLLIILSLILPFLLFGASLWIGSYNIPPGQILKTLVSVFFPSAGADIPQALKDVLFQIRLPRLLLALTVGAALSVCGASLQALFKNPLVNEYILGISFGAAFGASLSLVFLGKAFPPQVMAFLFAILAVLAVILIAGSSDFHIISILLTGIIVSAFFSALLSLVEFFASPYALQSLFAWLMGSLALATWRDLTISVPIMALGVTVLFLLRWRMNVLSMSDEEARALGVNIRREKILVIAATTLTTAAATSITGIIGWIGLIVPHLVRMLVGADNRRVIPLSAALGGSFLLLADDITRGIGSIEIPIGIFTSLIGIPLFLILLKKSRRIWL